MLPLLRRMAATLHRPRVRRIAVNELLALSDLALQDIGIDRSRGGLAFFLTKPRSIGQRKTE